MLFSRAQNQWVCVQCRHGRALDNQITSVGLRPPTHHHRGFEPLLCRWLPDSILVFLIDKRGFKMQ